MARANRGTRQALVIIEQMKNSTYLPNAYVDLGYIYERKKLFAEARNDLSQAIHFSLAVKNDESLMDAYQGVGEMYMADHKPSEVAVDPQTPGFGQAGKQ